MGMLVLSRKVNERIKIGDEIEVVVIEIRHRDELKVRLGIQAPKDVPVHRLEVYEAIQKSQEKSSELEPD